MDETMKPGKIFLPLLALTLAPAAIAGPDALLEQLRSDHAAMVSAEQDFHIRRERGVLKGAEAADYATYVARLHRQVAQDCVALADVGIPVPANLECPVFPSVLIEPAAIDQAGEMTGSEATAELDAELFSGMGEFDEMLLREQQRIKAATPHADEGGGGGAGGPGGADGGADGDARDGEDGDAGESGADGSGDTDSYGEGAGPGSQRHKTGTRQPPNIPDGSDDDVVARQLREAAEKETDPELKKKLWEEYRKYKAGTS
jgi:hypothetical protein